MTLYRAGNEVFDGFPVAGDFISKLSSATIRANAGWSNFYRAADEVPFIRNQTVNFTDLTQGVVGRIAGTTGFPSYLQEDLVALFAAGSDLVIGRDVDWERVSRLAIGGAAKIFGTAFEGAAAAGQAVPFLNIIVNLGLAVWDVVNLAQDYMADRDRDQESLPAQAAMYSKTDDEQYVNAVLFPKVASMDWTDFFSAPVMPNGMYQLRVEDTVSGWTTRGYADGERVMIGGDFNRAANGLVPGLDRQCSDFFQFAKAPGYSFGFSIEEQGDLMPSACQFGIALWQMVMKNSQNMFRIDPDPIIASWDAYFDTLARFAMTFGSGAGKTFGPQAAVALGSAGTWAMQYEQGGEAWSNVEGFAATSSQKSERYPVLVPKKYRQPRTMDTFEGVKSYWPTSQLIEYILRDVWETRVSAALQTVTVAYIDESFPTIRWLKRNRPQLFAKYESNRGLLPSHSAVVDVDASMIPDGTADGARYKARIVQAQRARGIVATTEVAGVKPPPREGPQLDGEIAIEPQPPTHHDDIPTVLPIGMTSVGQPKTAVAREPSGNGGGGVAIAVGVAAVAAGGLYLAKRKK